MEFKILNLAGILCVAMEFKILDRTKFYASEFLKFKKLKNARQSAAPYFVYIVLKRDRLVFLFHIVFIYHKSDQAYEK